MEIYENQVSTYSQYAIIGYLGSTFLAEWIGVNVNASLGLVLYCILLELVLFYVAYNWRNQAYRHFLPLALIPLIRILGFSLPLLGSRLIFWYPVISFPLFTIGILIIKILDYKWDDIGFNLHWFPIQIAIALGGIELGYSLYVVKKPILAEITDPTFLIFYCFVLFAVGCLEEFLFRGIMQTALKNILDDSFIAGIFVTSLYTILHINQGSPLYIVIIFGMSLVFGWLVDYTKSISGVMASHGIANIVFFLILPLAI